jgi:hypothetical protein
MSDTPNEAGNRQYKDGDGKPSSLLWLVVHEPEWAVNQIRHRDRIERELNAANARIGQLINAGDSLETRLLRELSARTGYILESNIWRSAKSLKP